MADIIVLILVFAYCGLIIYWKHTGTLKDSCSSCGSGGCGGSCGSCAGCGMARPKRRFRFLRRKKR